MLQRPVRTTNIKYHSRFLWSHAMLAFRHKSTTPTKQTTFRNIFLLTTSGTSSVSSAVLTTVNVGALRYTGLTPCGLEEGKGGRDRGFRRTSSGFSNRTARCQKNAASNHQCPSLTPVFYRKLQTVASATWLNKHFYLNSVKTSGSFMAELDALLKYTARETTSIRPLWKVKF
jgi:hypothetical protein